MKKWITLALILIMGFQHSYARTQLDSLENFLENNRLDEDGYRNTQGYPVTITATSDALEVANILGLKVNNTIDILYYFQRSQNSDGGFSETPGKDSELNATLSAIRGLNFLPVNSSQLHNWEIFNYINNTVIDLLYENISQTVGYKPGLRPLTMSRISLWMDYIVASYSLGFFPTLDSDSMIQELLAIQLNNGSYPNFRMAVNTILLLNLLGQLPTDPDLATKFILAHITLKGGFSFDSKGENSLEATYLGIRALGVLNKIDTIEHKNELTKFILSLQKSNSGFSKTINEPPNMHDTRIAVQTLFYLNELDELQAPDVLQTVGFVDFPWIIGVFAIVLLRRKKL